MRELLGRSFQVFRSAFIPFCAAAALVGAQISAAHAAYPERVIRSVVPFAPGGASDILARLFAQHLGEVLKQNVIVDNRAGAFGNIGIAAVAKAPPDGYTLLFSSIATTQNPAMFNTMPYDPLRDLVGVAQLAESTFMIAVNTTKLPVKSVKDLVDTLRANPGKYNAAAGGLSTRLTVEVFRLQNDLKVTFLNYNSAGLAVNALMSGEADLMIVDAAPLIPAIQSGRVKALAVTGETRLAALPDVPTFTEAGFPNYKEVTHFGVYMAAATPAPIVATIHDALSSYEKAPELRARLNTLGWEPVDKSQKEFDDFYKSEVVKWKGIVKAANIPPLD